MSNSGIGRTCLIRVVILALITTSGVVDAANVYWRPRLQAGAGHDNNVRMAYDVPNQEIERSALYQTQVDGELGIDGDTSKSVFFGRYWYQSVPVNEDYDADIKQVRWNFSNASERSLLTLDLDAQYDTTLTSEFESSGFSLRDKKDRRYFRGKVGYRWNLTPLDYVSGDLGSETVRYIDAENTGLYDYDAKTYTWSYGHGFSEVTNLGLQLVYSEFDIPDLRSPGSDLERSSKTENVISMLFGEYSVSERDKLTLQAGFRNSNFYNEASDGILYSNSKEEGKGGVFSVIYQRRFDVSNLQLSASRDLRPNGSGAVIEQDSIGIALQHSLTERLSFNISLSANRQREPARRMVQPGILAEITSDREFAQLGAGLRFSANEQNAIALEFTGRWQRYEMADEIKAESEAIFLRWYWTPPQISL